MLLNINLCGELCETAFCVTVDEVVSSNCKFQKTCISFSLSVTLMPSLLG